MPDLSSLLGDESTGLPGGGFSLPSSTAPTFSGPASMPSAPAKQGGGVNFGKILKQMAPAIMAAVAAKQGGRAAVTGMLQGFSQQQQRQQQQRREAEERELEQIADEEERQMRRQQYDRQRYSAAESLIIKAMQEANPAWSEAEVASYIDTADTHLQQIFGLPKGYVRQRMSSLSSRLSEESSTEAGAKIKQLQQLHGDQFRDLLENGATVKFGGKDTPIADVWKLANLPVQTERLNAALPTGLRGGVAPVTLAQKQTPILPELKSDDGVTGTTEWANKVRARLRALGRKPTQADVVRIQNEVTAEEEARLRGRRVPGSSRSEPVVIIQTVDAEGRPVTQVLPRSQAVGQTFAARPSAGQQQQMSELESGLDQIAQIRQSFNPDWVGPVAGRANQAKLLMPGLPVDPLMAEFYANVASLKNEVIRLITGAAVGVQEAERLMREIPDITNKPEVFQARLRNTERNRQRLLGMMRARQGGTGPTTATIGVPVGSTVRMRAPDGTVSEVPADQVNHYKSLGATVIR